MDSKALADYAKAYESRGSSPSSAPTETSLNGVAIPVKMSQTLAGIEGNSTAYSEGSVSVLSDSVPSSSAGDNLSEFGDRLACSTPLSHLSEPELSLNSYFERPRLSFSSLPFHTQDRLKALVGFDFEPLRHSRYPARVGTWPPISSATPSSRRCHAYVLYEDAAAAMAHSRHGPKPGEDLDLTTPLPIRQISWPQPSLLSQQLQSTGQHPYPRDKYELQVKGKPTGPLLPVLSDMPSSDLEPGTSVASGHSVRHVLEQVQIKPALLANTPWRWEEFETSNASMESDDDRGHEETPDHEEDEGTYERLASDMRNLIRMSAYGPVVEEHTIPIDKHISACLEKLLNEIPAYRDASSFQPRINQLAGGHSAEGQTSTTGSGQQSSMGRVGENKKRKNDKKQRRRRRDKDKEDADEDEDESDSDSGHPAKLPKPDCKFSCPFRKKNAIRFNIRDHPQCAMQSFRDLALLKRHVTSFHGKESGTYPCPRCKERLESATARDEHLRQEPACAVRVEDRLAHDHEDGINQATKDRLASRTNGTKVDDWDKMWDLLFPQGPSCTSSGMSVLVLTVSLPGVLIRRLWTMATNKSANAVFDPPVELAEVEAAFFHENNVAKLITMLQRIRSQGGHTLLREVHAYVNENLESCHQSQNHCQSEDRNNKARIFMDQVSAMQQLPSPPFRHAAYSGDLLVPPHPHYTTATKSDLSSQVETMINTSEDEAGPSNNDNTPISLQKQQSHADSMQGPPDHDPNSSRHQCDICQDAPNCVCSGEFQWPTVWDQEENGLANYSNHGSDVLYGLWRSA